MVNEKLYEPCVGIQLWESDDTGADFADQKRISTQITTTFTSSLYFVTSNALYNGMQQQQRNIVSWIIFFVIVKLF